MSLIVDIHKNFSGFSLDVAFETQGDCLGILGASGCGKSMTLKCIAGIVTPDRGHIELNGRVLFDSEKKINLTPQQRKVGYLFQNYALFPKMTVGQNIRIGIDKKDPSQEENVKHLIRSFHLEELENLYPRQLSGGQQQRAALARILAYSPEVLMLDEPFSALDAYLKEQLQFGVQHVLENYPGDVLMVTHSRDEVYRFCRQILVVDQGHAVDRGETRELFTNSGNLITAKLSGCKNFSRARKLTEHSLWAEDWKLELVTKSVVPENTAYVGIRAHDFIPVEIGEQSANVFSMTMVDYSEGPFEVTVRFAVKDGSPEEEKLIWWKLDSPVWEEKWMHQPPEHFYVDPAKVMPLTGDIELNSYKTN